MDLTVVPLEGLRRAEAEVDQAARKIARSPLSAEAAAKADSITLTEASVRLLVARNSYEANLRVLETAFEIEEHTLNILA